MEAKKNSGHGMRVDVAELLLTPEKNIPQLREIALGHRKATIRVM